MCWALNMAPSWQIGGQNLGRPKVSFVQSLVLVLGSNLGSSLALYPSPLICGLCLPLQASLVPLYPSPVALQGCVWFAKEFYLRAFVPAAPLL